MTSLLENILNVSFAYPWFLLALAGLPALWFFLRVTPPPPKQVSFPAIMLLTGIFNKNQSSDKAPWWLVALRLTLMTLLILAFAHPRLNQSQTIPGQGPVVIVLENDWASGQNWSEITQFAETIVDDASYKEREIYLALPHEHSGNHKATLEGPLTAQAAQDFLAHINPRTVLNDYTSLVTQLEELDFDIPPAIIWLNNGLETEDSHKFHQALGNLGSLYFYQPEAFNLPVMVTLKKDSLAEPSGILISVARPQVTNTSTQDAGRLAREVTLSARTEDGRILGQQILQFGEGEFQKDMPLKLPKNIVSDVASVRIEGQKHAGGLYLLDDRWRNTQVGILQPTGENDLPLLSESYYLDKASSHLGVVSIGSLDMLLRLNVGVMMMPDAAILSGEEIRLLENWLVKGGTLIRFAGRNLAHNALSDPLLPISLRHGGRALNGMLQWEKPASLKSFNQEGPLAGLSVPEDITIKQQVLAESTTDMSKTSWAQLEDGTSLISGKRFGQGWLVLFHTTANAEWSNIALSGIFPKILERLTRLSAATNQSSFTDLQDSYLPYIPLQVIDGSGQIVSPPEEVKDLDLRAPLEITRETPPGLYGGQGYNLAHNLSPYLKTLALYEPKNTGLTRLQNNIEARLDMRPILLSLAFILLLIDSISSLALRGQLPQLSQLTGQRIGLWIFAISFAAMNLIVHAPSMAQDETLIDTIVRPLITPQSNTFDSSTGLAYVKTGNSKIDAISHEGLSGLAFTLNQRTAIEAASPVGVNLKDSELAFYPLLYWPITADQKNLTQTEIDNVNSYLSFGGSILFDTRNPSAGSDALTSHLQRLTHGVNIPALVTVEPDHVLTKSFYLLQDFPGRWQGGDLWVEPIAAGTADGVSRIMVGQNDWASAWAMDEYGRPRFPVTPGGERQREMAYRFGVNLMMYMLTGNYKKDQVHIPAILERLGQ